LRFAAVSLCFHRDGGKTNNATKKHETNLDVHDKTSYFRERASYTPGR
jgi:hypothetical protein